MGRRSTMKRASGLDTRIQRVCEVRPRSLVRSFVRVSADKHTIGCHQSHALLLIVADLLAY